MTFPSSIISLEYCSLYPFSNPPPTFSFDFLIEVNKESSDLFYNFQTFKYKKVYQQELVADS